MAGEPRFAWDADLGRFRYASSGRLVPTNLVRDAVDTALANQQRRANALMGQLQQGSIETAEWELAMRKLVKDSHLYSAASGVGGFEQMTPQAYGSVGGRVASEYAYLRRFREGIEDGSRPLDGRAVSDAESYAEAARRTYHDAERVTRSAVAEERGTTLMVENELNPADHCDECEALAEAGLMDPEDMPSPGDRECGNRCKCTLRYVEVAASGERSAAGEEEE